MEAITLRDNILSTLDEPENDLILQEEVGNEKINNDVWAPQLKLKSLCNKEALNVSKNIKIRELRSQQSSGHDVQEVNDNKNNKTFQNNFRASSKGRSTSSGVDRYQK